MKVHVLNSLRRAVSRIEADPAEHLTLDQLAAEAHLSPSHFSRLFKHAAGCTVMNYRLRRRLDHAALRLQNSAETITQIAMDHGFTSPQAFARAFRKVYGLRPSQYRATGRVRHIQGRLTMPTISEVTHVAQSLLQDLLPGIRLIGHAETLSDHHGGVTVMRVQTDAPDLPTVILRTFKDYSTYDPDSGQGPASGLFAEWAALNYLQRYLPDDRFARVLAADRERGVLVLSDFGAASTLDQLLCTEDCDHVDLITQLSETLADLHAVSLGRLAEYESVYASLGPLPEDDSMNRHMESAERVLDDLNVSLGTADKRLVSEAGNAVTSENRWFGIQHMEPGADNVIVVDDKVRLIDFEGSIWGNVLRDVAFPAMASGHLPSTTALPARLVTTFEDRYFERLATHHPALADSGRAALPTVKLALALEVLGAYFEFCQTEVHAPWGGGRCRSQIISQWLHLESHEQLRSVSRAVLTALGRVWQQWNPQPLPSLRPNRPRDSQG